MAGTAPTKDAAVDTVHARLELLAGGLGGSGTADGVGAAAHFGTPLDVAYDGAGNLFVADWQYHTIRKIILATGVVTTLAGSPGNAGYVDGVGAAARFNQPVSLTADDTGNLFVGDLVNHALRKIVVASGAVSTVVGPSGWGPSRSDAGALAPIGLAGLATDGKGNVYVSDGTNPRVLKVVVATGAVSTLAGSGAHGTNDGLGSSAEFDYPNGMASDGAGNLYVADTNAGAIRTIVIATGRVTTLVSLGSFLNGFQNIASDGAGNLFVSNTSGQVIKKIEIATGSVTTLAGSEGNAGREQGVGTAARFSFPRGLAYDRSGNLFVADSGNSSIRKIVIATTAVSAFAGSPAQTGNDDGIGGAARFGSPRGLACDEHGDLYVADTGNKAIRKVVTATGAVTTVDVMETVYEYGKPKPSPLLKPTSIAVDNGKLVMVDERVLREADPTTGLMTSLHPTWSDAVDDVKGLTPYKVGTIFVTDGCLIQKIAIDENRWESVSGSCAPTTYSPGSPWESVQGHGSDGEGANATFVSPDSITYDGDGNLFVADSWDNTVRKIVIATTAVTTLAGSPGQAGSADGIGPAARFDGPLGLTSDRAGNLFVADTNNHAIRKIVVATGAVTTIVGSPEKIGVVPGPLPALLNEPRAVTACSSKDLFILDENSVLAVHF
jgi:sugar lactone lactonase YvrE